MASAPPVSAMLASVALWRVVLVCFVSSCANAATLRQGESHLLRGAVLQKASSREIHSCSCAAQASVSPCDCGLPKPMHTPEEMQYQVITLATDTAVLEGKARISQAGLKAADAAIGAIKGLDPNLVRQAGHEQLAYVIAEEEGELGKMIDAERARQAGSLKDMEGHAKFAADLGGEHIRGTAEDFARSQAANYISAAATGTMRDAWLASAQIPQIRQEATELAKGAIQAAAHTLTVANKAQSVSNFVPQAKMQSAVKFAQDLKTRQQALRVEIKRATKTLEEVTQTAKEAHDAALVVLTKAIQDDKKANEDLETARGNAIKVKKLLLEAEKAKNTAVKVER